MRGPGVYLGSREAGSANHPSGGGVDTVAGRLSLPADKLLRLCTEVDSWLGRKVCRRRDLESLVGVLQHAAKVVPPGRTSVRQMIDLLKGPRRPHYFIRLNQQFRADLYWWKTFAEKWNGVALFPPAHEPTREFASDAFGAWGCGAWWGDDWWQWEWPQGCERGIVFKELFAVILSVAVWGRQWRGQHVQAHCDNEAVVHMMASSQLMHLLRCIFFIEAGFGFTLSVVHITGVANDLADDLSRDKLVSFLQKVPTAQPQTPLPPPLIELLLDTAGTWTSRDWTQRFSSIVV